jgi:hypothetical protein
MMSLIGVIISWLILLNPDYFVNPNQIQISAEYWASIVDKI